MDWKNRPKSTKLKNLKKPGPSPSKIAKSPQKTLRTESKQKRPRTQDNNPKQTIALKASKENRKMSAGKPLYWKHARKLPNSYNSNKRNITRC